MMTNSPIYTATDLMRSIASAMDALLAFWKDKSPTPAKVAGIRNAVDFIDSNFAGLRDLVPQVREYVEDAWNDIVVNEMQRLSVRRLSLACRAFMDKCVEFENVWNENEESAYELFDDEWRARKYLVLCHESLNDNREIHTAAARGCLPQYSSGTGNEKKARLFKDYFVDVSDEALDYFVRFAQPLSPHVKWMGSRAEAVIFAEEFGLTAKDMNKSFFIPSRSGNHRDLSLAGESPAYKKSQYPIWNSIQKYKAIQKDGELRE